MSIFGIPRFALVVPFFALLAQPSLAAIPAPADQIEDERSILAADAQQRLAVASVDIVAIGDISHPDRGGLTKLHSGLSGFSA